MSAELPRQNRFELEGSVVQINELQSFDSGFTKREFVVSVEDGPYANDIKFDTVRDKTALLDGLSVGDSVKVSFNTRGNESSFNQNKFFLVF